MAAVRKCRTEVSGNCKAEQRDGHFTDLLRIKLAEQRHGSVFLGPTSAREEGGEGQEQGEVGERGVRGRGRGTGVSGGGDRLMGAFHHASRSWIDDMGQEQMLTLLQPHHVHICKLMRMRPM